MPAVVVKKTFSIPSLSSKNCLLYNNNGNTLGKGNEKTWIMNIIVLFYVFIEQFVKFFYERNEKK